MASWVAHLRVADKMKELFKGHEYAFYTGNLAPDGSVTGFINGFSKFENDIIEYFEKDGLTIRIKQICQFYKDIQSMEYKPSGINYFSPSEIETLVSRAASELGERIGIAIS